MQGLVLQSTGSWYKVLTNHGQEIECRLKGKMRQEDIESTNPVAVGDEVMLEQEDGFDTASITEVLTRRNYIIRQSPRKKWQKHIIAANIDQALLMITFTEPRTSLGFIDRYLLTAAMYEIPAVLIFNKYDAYKKKDLRLLQEALKIYEPLGYKCLTVSALTGQGLPEMEQVMKDKISLISGHSGVGKSTLVNAISPQLNLATNQISTFSGKGMHTTTFACMYKMPMGGFIIDTPGIKEFGIVYTEPEEISHYLPEML
ncbi:MAG TPA: ribosome small subunit-dependent GTPase A, partial [Chitinophagales bacterium]|nr:ribosome small subunit-dependent GTPase A [Chitinophagales bacterium]